MYEKVCYRNFQENVFISGDFHLGRAYSQHYTCCCKARDVIEKYPEF